MNIKKQLNVAGVLIAGVALFASPGNIFAQATSPPQLLFTWRASTYAPADFRGKLLPVGGSRITASFEVVDRGQLVNLSKQLITWRLNNKFMTRGLGIQTVNFRLADIPLETVESVQIQLTDYKNSPLLYSASIPVASPQAVIEWPSPLPQFSNIPFQVRARPYYFNVTNAQKLTYSWKVNGKAPEGAETPDLLTVNLNQNSPSGSLLNIGLTIGNPANPLEQAAKSLILTFTPFSKSP